MAKKKVSEVILLATAKELNTVMGLEGDDLIDTGTDTSTAESLTKGIRNAGGLFEKEDKYSKITEKVLIALGVTLPKDMDTKTQDGMTNKPDKPEKAVKSKAAGVPKTKTPPKNKGFKVGDKVTVEFEDGDYEGIVSKINKTKAVINFDDGDVTTFDIGDLKHACTSFGGWCVGDTVYIQMKKGEYTRGTIHQFHGNGVEADVRISAGKRIVVPTKALVKESPVKESKKRNDLDPKEMPGEEPKAKTRTKETKTVPKPKGPGVISSITNIITEHGPISHDDILSKLVKLFPDKNPDSMNTTLRWSLNQRQLTRLKEEKNVEIHCLYSVSDGNKSKKKKK